MEIITVKNIFYIIILLCSSVYTNANQNDEIFEYINTSELNVEKSEEIKDFIIKYAVRGYINGYLDKNLFKYDSEKFKKLKRKIEKASIYDVRIEKVDEDQVGVNEKNIIFMKNNYKITFSNNSDKRDRNIITPSIEKEYISLRKKNDYSIKNLEGKEILNLDYIINDYIIKNMTINIEKNKNIEKKHIDYIIKEKKRIISGKDSISINICIYRDVEFDNFLKIKLNESTYSLLINESCYKGIESAIEYELYKINNKNIKKDEEKNIIFFDTKSKTKSLNFRLENKDNIFLKLGKFFFKDEINQYIKREDKSKPYVYIKTNKNNLDVNFAEFYLRGKCLSYFEDETRIEICNLSNNKESNKLTKILNVY